MTKIEQILHILRRKNLKICTAESFTGGSVASSFVSIAGASDVFSLGLVCYTYQAKMQMLGVAQSTLSDFGAVSEQTVSEMLDGLDRLNIADIMLATSGNAGPTAEKDGEVGVFYLGVMQGGKKTIRRYKAQGDRQSVIDCGVDQSINLILELIKEK